MLENAGKSRIGCDLIRFIKGPMTYVAEIRKKRGEEAAMTLYEKKNGNQ